MTPEVCKGCIWLNEHGYEHSKYCRRYNFIIFEELVGTECKGKVVE